MAKSAAKARERGFCGIHPRERKNSFAKEWRKVLAKDHVIRIESHQVFNKAQLQIAQKHPRNHKGSEMGVPLSLSQCQRFQRNFS